jgi:hypothetical protein
MSIEEYTKVVPKIPVPHLQALDSGFWVNGALLRTRFGDSMSENVPLVSQRALYIFAGEIRWHSGPSSPFLTHDLTIEHAVEFRALSLDLKPELVVASLRTSRNTPPFFSIAPLGRRARPTSATEKPLWTRRLVAGPAWRGVRTSAWRRGPSLGFPSDALILVVCI